MRKFRTDLAIELHEINNKNLDGVTITEQSASNFKISKVSIENQNASKKFGKPMGIYYTVDLPNFDNLTYLKDEEIEFISGKISEFLGEEKKLVFVVGLGNRDITPDSLGPRTISKIFSTRHMKEDETFSNQFKCLRSVATIAPGVLGQTGIEICEIVKSIAQKIKPSTIIVIDALVSNNINRLGSTIQISNSGISPGSGVMNPRKEISQKILGVPIISVGIPTVVDAKTIIKDVINYDIEDKIEPMIVTPKEIDNIIKHAADILGLIINKALQTDLSLSEIRNLIS